MNFKNISITFSGTADTREIAKPILLRQNKNFKIYQIKIIETVNRCFIHTFSRNSHSSYK